MKISKHFTISLIILVVLTFSFCAKSYAQFSSAWSNRYSHTTALNFSHESRKIATDGSGNVFVLADITSDTDPNGVVTGSTYHYAVILKYDSNGALLAEEDILTNGHNVVGFDNLGGFGMELDASGNIYVGYLNYDAVTNYDVQIAKYDNSLNLVWLTNYNPTSADIGVDMKYSPALDMVYFVCKSTSGPDVTYNVVKAVGATSSLTNNLWSFDINTEIIAGMVLDPVTSDIYVTGHRNIGGVKSILTAKLFSSSPLLWKNIYNGGTTNRDDFGTNITMGADGYVYVAGTSDRGAPTGNDALVAKYDPSGGKIYWITYLDNGNSNTDAGRFVLVPDIDYVYIGSSTGSAVMIERVLTATGTNNNGGPGSVGTGNLTRVIYNPIPVEPYNSLGSATLMGMGISLTKKVHLTGTINATNVSGQPFSAAFLVRYIETPPNTRGHIFRFDSERNVEGTNFESYRATGIALDYVNENVYWLREFFSSFGTHQEERVVTDGLDILSQFKLSSGNAYSDISVYPIPASDIVSISSPENITALEISDVQGKLVKSVILNQMAPQSELHISDLTKGVYIGKVYMTSGEIKVIKLIKD